MKVFLTGGAGFIGRNFVERLVQEPDIHITVFDAFTYAVHPATEAWLNSLAQVSLIKGDVRNYKQVEQAIFSSQPDRIVHMAAESHVDRSIEGPQIFFETNVTGTLNMLQATKAYLENFGCIPTGFLYLQISTDEVYGPTDYPVDESAPYNPSSPYAASKAAADQLVNAWSRTYSIPSAITFSTNNYGPWQNPEKLVPKAILSNLAGQPISLYGDGLQKRVWLYVEDHVDALTKLIKFSIRGKMNIEGVSRISNVELMHEISKVMINYNHKMAYILPNLKCKFIKDRLGHDSSYYINGHKLRNVLGWSPKWTLSSGIEKTVEWFIAGLDR